MYKISAMNETSQFVQLKCEMEVAYNQIKVESDCVLRYKQKGDHEPLNIYESLILLLSLLQRLVEKQKQHNRAC